MHDCLMTRSIIGGPFNRANVAETKTLETNINK